MSHKLPLTIITGYVGSGKTTILLNLARQLRASNPDYRLALIKNEIGDLDIDSQLAASESLTGAKELLGACICCTNVGQIGESIGELERDYNPDRVIIETSGSAEPIKLVMEIKRLGAEREKAGQPGFELDGIISVIDVLNWAGYASTSFTAKLQARQTDLIVLNKWEDASEQVYDQCLDRLGDMDVETPHVKSDRGWVNKDLLLGFDAGKGYDWDAGAARLLEHSHDHDCDGDDEHVHHMEEMECLSITLSAKGEDEIDMQRLEALLKAAPKDEVFRIKAVVRTTTPPEGADGTDCQGKSRYILNWAFGRHSWTRVGDGSITTGDEAMLLRMSVFTARYESAKWQKRLATGQYIGVSSKDSEDGHLTVKKML